MIDSILKEDFARKLFGKSELCIIEKQIKGLTLTQSEKNRLSRDIRPKLNAIKEFSSYKDEFELKHDQNYKKIKEKLISLIKQHELFPSVLAIILFGSHADKSHLISSDIDFAVIMKNGTPKDFFNFRANILGNFDLNVDFQVYNELSPKIQKSIQKNYKLLYKKSNFNIVKYFLDENKKI